MAASAAATPNGKTTTPTAVQTAKYETPTTTTAQPACTPLTWRPNDARYRSSDGVSDGNIIATIITAHIPTNDAIAPNHDCPGITIHMCDIVQPPGICIPPIVDMDAHVAIVIAALATKTIAETPSVTRRELTSRSC